MGKKQEALWRVSCIFERRGSRTEKDKHQREGDGLKETGMVLFRVFEEKDKKECKEWLDREFSKRKNQRGSNNEHGDPNRSLDGRATPHATNNTVGLGDSRLLWRSAPSCLLCFLLLSSPCSGCLLVSLVLLVLRRPEREGAGQRTGRAVFAAFVSALAKNPKGASRAIPEESQQNSSDGREAVCGGSSDERASCACLVHRTAAANHIQEIQPTR